MPLRLCTWHWGMYINIIFKPDPLLNHNQQGEDAKEPFLPVFYECIG